MSDQFPATKIYNIYDYEPYRTCGVINPKRNTLTLKMMDLKNPAHPYHQNGINYFMPSVHKAIIDFYGYLKKRFNSHKMQIAIVPSSKKGITGNGLEAVISGTLNPNIIYNPLFLHRDYNVNSAKEGGSRSIQKHIDSISLKVNIDVNIPTLIIDDVTTTGSSLEACRNILIKAGVKTVYMMAIGKTV